MPRCDFGQTKMKLFAGLKKIRDYEKLQLPFLKSMLEFDIVIEVGYGEEQGEPISIKQLFLLNICSRNTVRRKLARLIDQGIIVRRTDSADHRASLLRIDPTTIKLLGKYGGALSSVAASHFK